ncbi:MAG TPA: hypothetical protein VJU86_12010 [Pyrinomonadaceae bacterium]|nr:hypothetical protein [Pyrinomonadaceae bacterium]
MSTDQAREIAERIARKVSSGYSSVPDRNPSKSGVNSELEAVRAGISELQKKLAQLEAQVSSDPSDARSANIPSSSFVSPKPELVTHSPWLAGINAPYSHPSQEKFGVEEATVTELVDFFEKEKICNVEPGGKPCDHCAMCSTRGF